MKISVPSTITLASSSRVAGVMSPEVSLGRLTSGMNITPELRPELMSSSTCYISDGKGDKAETSRANTEKILGKIRQQVKTLQSLDSEDEEENAITAIHSLRAILTDFNLVRDVEFSKEDSGEINQEFSRIVKELIVPAILKTIPQKITKKLAPAAIEEMTSVLVTHARGSVSPLYHGFSKVAGWKTQSELEEAQEILFASQAYAIGIVKGIGVPDNLPKARVVKKRKK